MADGSEREQVEWLVEMHIYLCDAPRMTLSKLKPVLARPGIGELLALHRADALACGRSLEHVEFCEAKLREWSRDELEPAPLITGDDLRALGLTPGPLFKKLDVRPGRMSDSGLPAQPAARTPSLGVSAVERFRFLTVARGLSESKPGG